jgi:hypothetical protein
MKKKVNYQRTLSEALGNMKWDTKCFVVHHINHNRDDNNIYNLVLIPKKLHKKYHLLISLASSYCEEILKKDGTCIPISHLNTISRLIDCKNDIAIVHQAQVYAINSIKKFGYSEEIMDLYYTNIREIIIKYGC